jgi:hypothetical protein
MLPTTCFQNEERWRSAKRCAANSHRKTGAPPAPRPPRPLPSHHTHQSTIFVVPVLWQHECAHGCSSCEYSLWNILAFGRPSYSYCRVRSVLELLHGEPFIGTLCSSIFGTSVGQTDKSDHVRFVRVRFEGFLIGMGNPESCPVQRMRAQALMVWAPRKLP